MASKEYVGQVAAQAKEEAIPKTEYLKSLILAMEQRLDAKFDKIDDKFEKLENKVDSIEIRLNGRLDNMVFAFIAAAVSMVTGFLCHYLRQVSQPSFCINTTSLSSPAYLFPS